MSHAISIDKSLRARLLAIEPKGQEMEEWCWAACSQMVVSYLRSNMGDKFSGLQRPTDNEDLRQGEQANSMRSRFATDGHVDIDCKCAKTTRDYEACNKTGWPDFFEFEAVAQSTQLSSLRFIVEQLGVPLRENGWPRTVVGKLSSLQLRDLLNRGGPEFHQRLYEAEDCALSWPMLQSLLDHDLPVIFGWRFVGGGGHFMIAAGYVVTPSAERWVVVIDPLPPDHGDWYLVPYDYWVAGPEGRHWRDWWVPCPVAGQALPPRNSIDHLRVGRELTRSTLSVSRSRPSPAKHPGGAWLTERERPVVLELAHQGLAALKAIASQAPELTAMLGMGGSWLRLVLKGFILSYLEADGKPEQAAKIDQQLKSVRVEPENLILNEKDYIPVFRLYRKSLADWDGKDPKKLLTAPKQLVFRVERGDLTDFDFFSTVTVERYDDGWRLASLGRSSLMSSLTLGQFFAVLGGGGEQEELSIERLVRRLDELDLLETIAGLIPITELDAELARSTEDSSEVDQELVGLRELLGELRKILEQDFDSRALKKLAKQADQARKVEEKSGEQKNPKFAVDVAELYQLFIAYNDDELEPVYPSSFYPPGRRVSAGDRVSVLRQLKRLAEQT